MGKKSMQRATGLSQEERENLAKSGQRKNLNNNYSKPSRDLFSGVRGKQLTNIPLDLQDMLLDALSSNRRKTTQVGRA
jgi:hypothetical protein